MAWGDETLKPKLNLNPDILYDHALAAPHL
jgi:hypothetical protein